MIIARAPLRIPFGGGGTDLHSYFSQHGGFILSAAINKHVYIYANHPAVDRIIRLKYSKTEEVHDASEIQHPLLREALRLTDTNGGLEIAAMADIPAGTGLGSSGSFLVALLQALHAFRGENLPAQELAEEACRVEIEMARQPAGKHDAYLAAFGGITCLEIARNGRVRVTQLDLPHPMLNDLRANLLLFYTGIRRESFDILAEQGRDVRERRGEVLGSMHEIKRIGLEVRDALLAGDLATFGRLMHRHWECKKRISTRMSDSRIDGWYDAGMAAGALGGKLLGAGGGGFLMFYAEGDARQRLRSVMAEQGLRELPFDFEFAGSKVLVNL